MLTTACQVKRPYSKLFIMTINICMKKAWQKLRHYVKPGYFLDDGSPFFYYSYFPIVLCVYITLIITFTQAALLSALFP